MAERPTYVDIGVHRFSIAYDADKIKMLEVAKYETDGQLLGYTQKAELMITLHPNLPESLLKETVLHEILHAMFFVHALTADGVDDNDNEEDFIRAFSGPWMMLIKDNRHVFSWIYAEEG